MQTVTTYGNGAEDLGKLILRGTLGVLILLHGISKVVSGPAAIMGMVQKAGLPAEVGYLVYLGEVVGPVLVILGLWTRVGAALIAINMIVAIALVHMGELFTLSEHGGWALELQGMFLVGAIAVALLGAGRYSLGGATGRWN